MSNPPLTMATKLIPKGIRLVLIHELSKIDEDAAQELALSLLATALHAVKNIPSQAWMVEQVKDSAPLTFMLTPVPGQSVSAQHIASLKGALCTQPCVGEVTPLF